MTIGPFSADHESKNKDQQCNGFTVKMAAKFASCKIFLLFLAWQLFCRQCLASNKALGRNITANVTCGSPPELYYKIWQADYRPRARGRGFTCDASNATLSHPPKNMVDGSNLTYWQTKASKDVAYINLDLRSSNQQFIFVRKIEIQFGAYQRPGQIEYSKSIDGGLTYQPWHYFVTRASQCGSSRIRNRPFNVDDVLCTYYPLFLPKRGNETVSVDLFGGRASSVTVPLQRWMNATNIRIRFSGLYLKFDVYSVKWHHYVVNELSVAGDCFCNGHASECNVNATSGERNCRCESNTCGPKCDRCCPAYNQYPFKQGKKAPFEVDRNAACLPCNCHNHSSVCTYNQTIADSRQSLNISGFYSGGGVCQDCQHKTTGINCEKCIEYNYRPKGKSKLVVDVCEECNCSRLGTRNETGVSYLDCIRDETVNVSGMGAGDCYCKQNVFRRQCDTCKPGFYNLTSENPSGCQDCSCFLPGTVNGSNVCMPDSIGDCPCKINTEGRICSTCKNEFFNLTSTNANGCENCGCDPGGRNATICDKISGQCSCKNARIVGRKCDRPIDGYYYPNLHYQSFAVAIQSLPAVYRGQITVPSFQNGSGIYYIILKYTSTVTTQPRVTISETGSAPYLVGSLSINPACRSTCFTYVNRNVSLSAGQWQVFINLAVSINSEAQKIALDSVVLLPSEFKTAGILGAAGSREFLSRCDVLRNNMTRNGKLDDNCLKGVYSVTMGLLNQPIDCACNLTGSVNGICEKYDGQCTCKPGVTGKKCDKCLPRFYNFTTEGCSACNCSSDNKECNQVSGQCSCPPNTVGRTCGQCESLFWGWNSTTGCKACGCNTTGSSIIQCDLMQGNCSCKNGVGGTKCSQCLDTFTRFSASGCSPCNCSRNGSRSGVCDKLTSQCPCKENTRGTTCDRCSSQSFYLSGQHAKGCMSCICMGITTNCSSSLNYVYKQHLSAHLWRVGYETSLLNTSSANSTIGSGVQSIPAVSSNVPNHSQTIYWTAPANFIRNSLVGAYGGSLEFTLFHSMSGGSINISQFVILKGKGITLYRNFTSTTPGLINVRQITMTEAFWRYSNGSAVSRSMFLLALAKPTALLISASPYQSSSVPYTSRLGGLSISNTQTNVTASGRALSVESCECGEGYIGSSCERCAVGYKRSKVSSHSYLGTCVPCQCNGHSDRCDPDTGRCLNCLHNTTGDSCQFCLPSFYGNATIGATTDCQRCPCDAPRTTSSLCELSSNGTVQCLNCSTGYEGDTCDRCSHGFFGQPTLPGGICSPCQCTNNSDVCNRTSGVCQNCQFNTSGDHCERCRDGWYGDAASRTCQACDCNTVGSLSSICNYTTGQCSCRNNVIGMSCSSCRNNTYGLNNITGCLPCNCNPSGSARMQCNESGVCSCNNNTVNPKCDRCEPGYFGLPAQSCQVCNCNDTGSWNTSCSVLTGRCYCKPGVENRNCNTCMKQHINFNSSGCTACPPCSQLLQRKLDMQFSNGRQTYTNLQTVRKMANLTSRLTATERRLNTTQASKIQFDSRITTLQAGINRIKSDALSRSISGLLNRTNAMERKSLTLMNQSTTEQQRIEVIRTQSEVAANNVISVNNSISSLNLNLQRLKFESEKMLSNIQNLNFNFTHQQELQYAEDNATDAQALLLRVQNVTASVTVQEVQVNRTASAVSDLQSNLTQQQRDFDTLASDHGAQQKRLTDVQSNLTVVKGMLMNLNATLKNTSLLLDSAQSDNANISQSLRQSRITIKAINETLYNETGLVNSLNQLSTNVDELLRNATTAQVTANKASDHAANLSSEAASLTRTFQPAKTHGSNAVNAVRRYEEISKLINQSMELSKQANTSVQQVYTYLQISGNQNLTEKSLISRDESRMILAASTNQQSEVLGLQTNFSQANTTFRNIENVGKRVSHRYNIFRSSLNALSVTSENGSRPHSLETAIQLSGAMAYNVTSTNEYGIMESRNLAANITSLNGVLRSTNATAKNATSLLNEVWSITNNITRKMNSPTNSPSDDTNIINRMIQQFNSSTKPLLDGRLASIQSKINALKMKIAKQQAAITLNGSNSVVYQPASSSLLQSPYSEIQMDFRTTQSNSFLLSFGNQSSTTADKMSLKVLDSKVVFQYTINGRVRSLTNWEVGVSDGGWRRVYASRQGVSSRLTVSVLGRNYSRTYSYSEAAGRLTTMTYPVGSSIYLGGLAKHQMVNSTVESFAGCMDNIRVNKLQLSLWNYSSATHKPEFCNSSSLLSQSERISGSSFFGNGFVKLRMGNFSVRNYSRVEFEFRTLQQNGTLFAVQGTGDAIIYSIVLVQGTIHFLFTAPFSSGLRTSRNSYADGNRYKVVVSRSTNHISLAVTSVANGTGELPLQLSSSSDLLSEGKAMFFGGVNGSSVGQLSTAYKYAGCISNVTLSNNATGNNDLIKLNDASLLLHANGVSFDGCLPKISSGLRFLGSGFSSATTSSSRISTLDIVFKTTEPNGVLFFAQNKGMKFYIALYHGNVFLEYKNASNNARTVAQTERQTLNNGLYQTVRVVFASALMSLSVNGLSQSKQLQSGLAPSVQLNGRLYVGGVPQTMLSSLDEFPVNSGFQGDMRTVKLNELDISRSLLLQANHLSIAGVKLVPDDVYPTPLPTTPAPTTPPPSCAAARGAPQTTSAAWAGIGANSTLGMRAKNPTVLTYFQKNYVIEIQFRAFNPYGVVFYARSTDSQNQFIALELVDSKLVYRFDAGNGVVEVKTTHNYAQGVWYQVYFLRMSQFGAMLVNGEYQKNDGSATGSATMNISFPLYLGGVPDDVQLTTLKNPNGSKSFRGCIRDLQVKGVGATEEYKFDIRQDRDASVTRNIRQCYVSVTPSVRLQGNGYLLGVENVRTSPSLTVSLKFRTSQRNGILWNLYGRNGSPSLLLEQVSGQIILSLSSNANVDRLIWTDPNLAASKAPNSSYAICNNVFHTVAVSILQSNYTMTVNTTTSITSVSALFTSSSVTGSLYVGGSPRISRAGITGCIQNLVVNGKVSDLAASASSTGSRAASSGCS